MNRFVVISGCSGGGKSTLLAELAHRGFHTVEEPGRRIVEEELAGDGSALPWVDGTAFARRAIAMALADLELADLEKAAALEGWVFFDRGLVDAAAYLEHLSGEDALARWDAAHLYHHRVFLTPPWPEIYRGDAARRHDLDIALAEYDRLLKTYPALGYETVVLPKDSVAARVDFILATLKQDA
ncbi:MAG: AAA family ATPase [Methyloligella sp. ZOD6]